ncbi:solute carrier family 2, facilitated glucose transporter member 10 isoform X2 [Denticeps clupeoides]|uniref:solute carrier family 2, facilitated glucose transporter member 10 isoform X2 n=1 Tax=Denticeps clupeoides TaxID=299321 RepID=UPI0010A3652E|nr:solute carrier family 2, facilitated glucose transporter member 10 isoform X2 [Denticeps clupeoides]
MGSSVLLAALVSTLGGLVFGYELGIISGALLQLQAEFGLDCLEQEAVVSALLVGAALASVVGGWFIDRHGRHAAILASNVLLLGGSLVLAVGSSFTPLVLGRFAVGFAMCVSSMSCCIYVSEVVTPKRRGLMVTLYEAGITVGILAAYAVNYILANVLGGWKYMFGLAMVPSLGQFITIWFLPSVPQRPGSPNQDVTDADKKQYSILDLFQSKDNMRTRTAIGLGLVLFQQFTGQPNVLLYASTVFHSVGFHSNASAVLASLGLGVVKVIATAVSMLAADRVGRRPLLIGGSVVMAVCLLLIGILSGHSVLDAKRPCSSAKVDANGSAAAPTHATPIMPSLATTNSGLGLEQAWETPKAAERSGDAFTEAPAPYERGLANWGILVCMMTVVVTWLVLSEIFPASVRGRAFAFTSFFNWAANLVVTFSFLNVIDSIGVSGVFLLYAVVGVAAAVFVYFMVPETKGKTLQQIDKELCEKRFQNSAEYCQVMHRVSSPGYQRVDNSGSGV